jgi:hypothetical protein
MVYSSEYQSGAVARTVRLFALFPDYRVDVPSLVLPSYEY